MIHVTVTTTRHRPIPCAGGTHLPSGLWFRPRTNGPLGLEELIITHKPLYKLFIRKKWCLVAVIYKKSGNNLSTPLAEENKGSGRKKMEYFDRVHRK